MKLVLLEILPAGRNAQWHYQISFSWCHACEEKLGTLMIKTEMKHWLTHSTSGACTQSYRNGPNHP